MKQILLTLLSFGVLFPGITHYLNAQISVSHDSILLDHLSNMASSKDTSYFSDTIIPPYLTTFPAFFRDNEYHPGVEDTTFFDKYAIRTGRKIHGDNYFKVNRFTYELGKDYFPLPQTGNGEVKSKLIDVNFGINAPSLDYNDYEEFKARELKDNAFLIRLSTPDGYNQRSPFKKYAKVEAKSQEAIKRGASAVVFSNLDPNLPDPEFAINTIKDTFDVPILYLKEKHYRKLEYDYDYQTILQVSLKEIRQYGKSFLATKNVGASKTLLVISTYQPNDTIKNSNQQKNSSQKSAMSSFKEWGYRFAQDTSNSLNYMFALLPNDRTFDKGWERLQDVIFDITVNLSIY